MNLHMIFISGGNNCGVGGLELVHRPLWGDTSTGDTSTYNPSIDLNGQHLEAKKKITENDLSGGVGWVLIAMDGNVICNIGWNKSDIRNMKNQNFRISRL